MGEYAKFCSAVRQVSSDCPRKLNLMSQPKYIQDENVFLIIALGLICVAIIWWTYSSDKKRDLQLEKKNETVDSYTKSFSWRLYIIIGTGLLIMIWELVKRFINFCS